MIGVNATFINMNGSFTGEFLSYAFIENKIILDCLGFQNVRALAFCFASLAHSIKSYIPARFLCYLGCLWKCPCYLFLDSFYFEKDKTGMWGGKKKFFFKILRYIQTYSHTKKHLTFFKNVMLAFLEFTLTDPGGPYGLYLYSFCLFKR